MPPTVEPFSSPVESREHIGIAYAQYSSLLMQASLQLFIWKLVAILVLFTLLIASLFLTPSPLSSTHAEWFLTLDLFRTNYVVTAYMQSLLLSLLAGILQLYFKYQIQYQDTIHQGRFIFLREFEKKHYRDGLFSDEWNRVGSEYFSMRPSRVKFFLLDSRSIFNVLAICIVLINMIKVIGLQAK